VERAVEAPLCAGDDDDRVVRVEPVVDEARGQHAVVLAGHDVVGLVVNRPQLDEASQHGEDLLRAPVHAGEGAPAGQFPCRSPLEAIAEGFRVLLEQGLEQSLREIAVHRVSIPGVRLNAYLARAGVGSRRGADELIKADRVRVNGRLGKLNTFVAAHDIVEVDGVRVRSLPLAYVLLHKPAGAITTVRDPHGRRTVVDLVHGAAGVVPVGRLDVDTTGALLLMNDGELAHRLAHPRYEVDKVYEVEVEGDPSPRALSRLERGVELDDGTSAPARVRKLDRGRIELTIHEGRKHQIKRMCEAVGHPVRRLHRSRYAGLALTGLAPGESRELSREEVEELKKLVGLQ
jgi:23S rRNA pseudouridine2605 synthase